MKNILKLLQNPLTRWKGLEICRNLKDIDDKIIEELILCGLKENDPSFNGEYIKLCVKHRGTYTIGNHLIKYYKHGNFKEKIGSLKALYHVSEDPLILDEASNKFIENPKFKEHCKSYIEREKQMIQEYNICDNIILKFFFRWAIRSKESDFFINVPETYGDLETTIKDSINLKLLLEEYKEWN